MSRKIVKLTLALSMLAGSLMVGFSAKSASAASFCSSICCNASCTSIRRCYPAGSSCFCRAYCEPNLPGGD